MQLGGCLAPSSLGSPLETLKDFKIKKLSDFNSLTKTTKLIPTFTNAK